MHHLDHGWSRQGPWNFGGGGYFFSCLRAYSLHCLLGQTVHSLKPDEIQARLEKLSEKNDEREATVKRLFIASGYGEPGNLN